MSKKVITMKKLLAASVLCLVAALGVTKTAHAQSAFNFISGRAPGLGSPSSYIFGTGSSSPYYGLNSAPMDKMDRANGVAISPTLTSPIETGGTYTGGTYTGGSFASPTLTSPTETNPTVTSGTYTTPAITGGTSSAQALSSPAINGGTIVGVHEDNTSFKAFAVGAAAPTTTNIPAGYCLDWNNTVAVTTHRFCNVSGTIVQE